MCKTAMSKNFSKPVMVAAEYTDISADAIAAYLVDKLGVDAIFSEGAGA